MRTLARTLIYLLLAGGAAVFAFPFLWMAATSVKVDRELHTEEFRLLPMTPRPEIRSPYVDSHNYSHLDGPFQDLLLPRLEALVAQSGFLPPPSIDPAAAGVQIARGLYRKFRQRLPPHLWAGKSKEGQPIGPTEAVVDALVAAARDEITPEMIAESFDKVYRRLCMGPIRIRGYDREELELGRPMPLSERLENLTPESLTVRDVVDGGEAFALLQYDFSRTKRVVLSQTFTAPASFDLENLYKLWVDIRPDDTWHELWLRAECNGKQWRARRAFPLANRQVIKVLWQPPGPDDDSGKVKNWIRLEPIGPAPASDPSQIKLTFEFLRVGQAGAWWNKLSLNYLRTLEYLPLGRYLRISLFLVIANIVLTVVVSSLVAYAFARLHWPGRDFCFLLMLATMMIPSQVTMIPQFLIWKSLGAYNTLTPLWLGPSFGNAFFVFLLRQFMKGVPTDLEDAARLDGCGFLRIYWYVMLPLIKPSLAAIAIFTFLGSWNDFMGPLIYIADERLYPLAFGLYAYSVEVGNDPALTMAASFMMTVPVIVIFFFAQKYFIQGITLTGMKG